MAVDTNLFTEKFRPQKLEQLIAPERVRSQLRHGLVQNLLLFGSAGTGKTSTLFILAKDHPYLYINASDQRGIDIIRDNVVPFCSSISLEEGKEKLKCIILDELDGATGEFFKALRAVMEKYAKSARFIASCNFLNKIPEPIWESRFLPISYDPINDQEREYLTGEYKKRVGAILQAAKISYSEEILTQFVNNDFPDLRALMNKIQSLHLRGVVELSAENMATSSDFADLFHLCLQPSTKPYDNYKLIVNQFGSRIDESLTALGSDFPEYLKNMAPARLDKLPLVLIAIAEYQYQKSFVIDPLITLLAAVFRIQQILNS
jgi:DNA polymerase III delta prime subunit